MGFVAPLKLDAGYARQTGKAGRQAGQISAVGKVCSYLTHAIADQIVQCRSATSLGKGSISDHSSYLNLLATY